MFSKFPSFPFSITKCDIGGGGHGNVSGKKPLSRGGGGGGQHRGEGGGGGFRVMVRKSLKSDSPFGDYTLSWSPYRMGRCGLQPVSRSCLHTWEQETR